MSLYKFSHLCFRREAITLQEEKKLLQLRGRRPGLWRLRISNSMVWSQVTIRLSISKISCDALQAISVVLNCVFFYVNMAANGTLCSMLYVSVTWIITYCKHTLNSFHFPPPLFLAACVHGRNKMREKRRKESQVPYKVISHIHLLLTLSHSSCLTVDHNQKMFWLGDEHV